VTGWQWVGTGGIGIKAGQTTSEPEWNQGIGLNIENCYIYGSDGADVGAGSSILDYCFVIEDTDAVYIRSEVSQSLQSNLLIKANPGGHAPANHFFDRMILDGGPGQCVRITGAGSVSRTKFVGCWFASAEGGISHLPGFHADAGAFDGYQIAACNFINMQGTALSLNPATLGAGTISDNTFSTYGLSGIQVDAIYINSPNNGMGPTITGNSIGGGNGVAIRTSATSNRIVVAANALAGGVAFGTQPFVVSGNSEITNIVPESEIVGTAWVPYTPGVLAPSTGTFLARTFDCAYKKIGKIIFYRIQINITANGDGGGTHIRIGLPQAAVTADAITGYGVERGLTRKGLSIQPNSATEIIACFSADGSYPGGNGAILIISGTYEAA
jgi:hypothetical protein